MTRTGKGKATKRSALVDYDKCTNGRGLQSLGLALMEDWFPRGVFGKHPHRGIETVTYVVEGRIDHYDNLGHEGTILPGDVQWMMPAAD
jgi:redox-sensitive bicupin YhaK (pirin superfamily)